MLKNLKIENYRCFEHHEIEFKNLSIVVGKNNAGKSTLIEVLRLIAIVISKYQTLNYESPPLQLGLPRISRGIRPSLKGIDISPENLFYHYKTGPARIEVEFQNQTKIEIHVENSDIIYAIIYDNRGRMIDSKKSALLIELPDIRILPQISPLPEKEAVLDEFYVRANLNSTRTSLHFRNQLKYNNNEFTKFQRIVSENWDGLSVQSLEGSELGQGERLGLQIRENNFVAEVSWMGHGVQMWLQTMWFLCRCSPSSTVILDEPDVYMHADLQRKLIRSLKGRYNQIIITSHSTEIISEVEPDNILLIDKSKKKIYLHNKFSSC